eukprot:436501-Pelagomonas_calceolata.AAC.1
MDTETETGPSMDDVQERVFRQNVRGISDVRVFCWKCTPVMIGDFFAVKVTGRKQEKEGLQSKRLTASLLIRSDNSYRKGNGWMAAIMTDFWIK